MKVWFFLAAAAAVAQQQQDENSTAVDGDEERANCPLTGGTLSHSSSTLIIAC